jgi:rSAM/selenodomain-associated transferase 1
LNAKLLLLFTRYPEPGLVKTRLIPVLGAAGAAGLQRRLTAHIMRVAQNFSGSANTDLIICFDGPQVRQMQQLFGAEFCYQPQSGGDLGHRMWSALAAAFSQERRQIVLIGSDCPEISERVLTLAFSLLTEHDLVLGPARDGGYYLIGLNASYPELFQDMPWGTAAVLPKTLARAQLLHLRTVLLEPFTDIDRPEDLPVWDQISQRLGYE